MRPEHPETRGDWRQWETVGNKCKITQTEHAEEWETVGNTCKITRPQCGRNASLETNAKSCGQSRGTGDSGRET